MYIFCIFQNCNHQHLYMYSCTSHAQCIRYLLKNKVLFGKNYMQSAKRQRSHLCYAVRVHLRLYMYIQVKGKFVSDVVFFTSMLHVRVCVRG